MIGSEQSQYLSQSINNRPTRWTTMVSSEVKGTVPDGFPNERCAHAVTDGEKRKV